MHNDLVWFSVIHYQRLALGPRLSKHSPLICLSNIKINHCMYMKQMKYVFNGVHLQSAPAKPSQLFILLTFFQCSRSGASRWRCFTIDSITLRYQQLILTWCRPTLLFYFLLRTHILSAHSWGKLWVWNAIRALQMNNRFPGRITEGIVKAPTVIRVLAEVCPGVRIYHWSIQNVFGLLG